MNEPPDPLTDSVVELSKVYEQKLAEACGRESVMREALEEIISHATIDPPGDYVCWLGEGSFVKANAALAYAKKLGLQPTPREVELRHELAEAHKRESELREALAMLLHYARGWHGIAENEVWTTVDAISALDTAQAILDRGK